MDQLAEMYAPVSPYAYVANNPISFIDPDGRAIDPVKDKDGNITGWTFTGDDATAVGGYLKYGGDYGSLVSQLEGYGSNFGSGQISNFWSSFNSNGLNMKFVSTSSAGRNYFGANGVSHLATTVIDVSIMSFDDWVKGLGHSSTENGFDWGFTGKVLGLGNIAYDGLENAIANKYWWLDSKGRYRSTKLLEKGANGKYVRGVQGYRNGYASALKVAGKVKVAGNIVGGLSLITTGAQLYNNQITTTEAIVDGIFGVVGFMGPIGAGVSATYFLGKLAYETLSGDTLFDKPQ